MPASNLPIAFIVSAPRSGSTLLIRILDSHSKIAAPFEFGMPQILKGDRKDEQNLGKLKNLCQHYGLDYAQAAEDSEYLINSIIQKESKKFYVIKDPRHSIFTKKINEEFGDVPIIHLVRDARRVAHSQMFKKFRGALRLWRKFNQSILDNKHLFSSYIQIRYEDLVTSPEETLTRLVEFLGFEYEPEMQEYWNFEHTGDKLLDKNVKRGLDMHEKLKTVKKLEKPKPIELSNKEKIIYSILPNVRRLNRYFGYDI